MDIDEKKITPIEEEENKPTTVYLSNYSESKVISFEYTWVIDEFSRNSKCESPTFSPKCNENFRCFLRYDGSHSIERMYICFHPCNMLLTRIDFKYSVRNNADDSELFTASKQLINKLVSPTEITEHYCPSNDFRYVFQVLMPDEGVRVVASIKLIGDTFSTERNDTRVIEIPDGELPDNFGALLESARFSDVTIDVNGEKVLAHRAILAARSRVFAAMFEHKMAENQTSKIEITDIEPDVFRKMLEYIYTDKPIDLETMSDKLLIAAEKYELERLKRKCEEVLRANLTIENAADILILADHQNAAQLKERAIDFIATNAAVVKEQENFKLMVFSHPYLIVEILQASIKLR